MHCYSKVNNLVILAINPAKRNLIAIAKKAVLL